MNEILIHQRRSCGAPAFWNSEKRLSACSLCCCGALLVVTLAGCGSSASTDSTVVPPPAPTSVDAGAIAADPPGSIELPTGKILDEGDGSTTEGPATESGIQMPEGAKVPIDAGASTQSGVEYATWDEIHAVAKSNGRITVVDLWSLACEPCLKEFPGLVHLHESLGSTVQCIAVNLDFDGRKTRPPEHYEKDVVAFLASVQASGFPNYISRTPNEDIFTATRLASIPAVLVYDADGEIVRVFVDAGETAGFTYETDVIPLVRQLAG